MTSRGPAYSPGWPGTESRPGPPQLLFDLPDKHRSAVREHQVPACGRIGAGYGAARGIFGRRSGMDCKPRLEGLGQWSSGGSS